MCDVWRFMCHLTHVTYHVSHVTCPMSIYIFIYFFCIFYYYCFFNILKKFLTKWCSWLVEGLFSTGPTLSSFIKMYGIRGQLCKVSFTKMAMFFSDFVTLFCIYTVIFFHGPLCRLHEQKNRKTKKKKLDNKLFFCLEII